MKVYVWCSDLNIFISLNFLLLFMLTLPCMYRVKLKSNFHTFSRFRFSLLPPFSPNIRRLTTLEGSDVWRPYIFDSKIFQILSTEYAGIPEGAVPADIAIMALPMEIRQNSRQVSKKRAKHRMLPRATPRIWELVRNAIEREVLFTHAFQVEGHGKVWGRAIKSVDKSLHRKTFLQEQDFLFQVRQAVWAFCVPFARPASDSKV